MLLFEILRALLQFHSRIAAAVLPGAVSFVFLWSTPAAIEEAHEAVRVLFYAGLYAFSQMLLTVIRFL